ncbi:MAG: hypothetical protein ACM3PP_03145 [Candidatus Saccharibacteria bacterium]
MKIILVIVTITIVGMLLNGEGYFAGSNWLFDSCTALYGQAASRIAGVHVLWAFPLRSGVLNEDDVRSIAAGEWTVIDYRDRDDEKASPAFRILPETPDILDFDRIIKTCAERKVDALVESSGMDAWHTSRQGWQALHYMRAQTLRVVIFDGGHHLPTLGLQPDLVVVPDTMEYAAHGYMKDAVPIRRLQEIAARERLPFTIVSVSRWGLVKTSDSMSRITYKALAKTQVGDQNLPLNGRVMASHFTQWGSAAFVYIDNVGQVQQIHKSIAQNRSIKRLYAAFNYSRLNQMQVGKCRSELANLGLPVEIVNEPLNVPAVMAQEVF